jgi:uncharacterized protein (TIGR02145 family)
MNQLYCIALFLLFTNAMCAQVGINTDNNPPDPSAMLDVKSTTRGLLIPRMTSSQIGGLINPANGLQAFNTDDGKMYIYVSSEGKWKEVSYGTGFILPWNCGLPITDSRDGQIYNTTLIGTQCWLAQNMNIGIKIPGGEDQQNNDVIEKYCYENDDLNCSTYGGLYQYAEMVQYLNGASNTTIWDPVPVGNVPGICPAGWHLPGEDEWDALVTYLDPDAGAKMKEAGTVHWNPPNTGATNSSGFNCLPAGMISGSYFQWLNSYAELWSGSGQSEYHGWMRWLWSNMSGVGRSYREKTNGLAVRCIMN